MRHFVGSIGAWTRERIADWVATVEPKEGIVTAKDSPVAPGVLV